MRSLNGFYFVDTELSINTNDINSSVDIGMVSVDLKLYHCNGWVNPPYLVCDLGIFEAPENAFVSANGNYLNVRKSLETEHGFLQDTEHELLFVGGGPVGGKFKMTVFDWNDTTKKNLSAQDVVKTFTDEDLGGYADISTAVFFTEEYNNYNFGGGGGGCNSGMFGIMALAWLVVFVKKRK